MHIPASACITHHQRNCEQNKLSLSILIIQSISSLITFYNTSSLSQCRAISEKPTSHSMVRPPRILQSFRQQVLTANNKVMKKPLGMFSKDPMTGFYRNGLCDVGKEDTGNHSIAGSFLPYLSLSPSIYIATNVPTPQQPSQTPS